MGKEQRSHLGFTAEEYEELKRPGGPLYFPKNPKEEADSSELWLWRAANAMGITSHQESLDQLSDRLMKKAHDLGTSLYEGGDMDREIALGIGFFTIRMVRDEEFSGDEAWAMLCSINHAAGVIYGEYSPSGEAFNRLFSKDVSGIVKAGQSVGGKDAVAKKLEGDPAQRAKKYVKEKWGEWKKDPDLYGKYKADFARAMLKDPLCASLTNQAVIVRWCTAWEKGNLPTE